MVDQVAIRARTMLCRPDGTPVTAEFVIGRGWVTRR